MLSTIPWIVGVVVGVVIFLLAWFKLADWKRRQEASECLASIARMSVEQKQLVILNVERARYAIAQHAGFDPLEVVEILSTDSVPEDRERLKAVCTTAITCFFQARERSDVYEHYAFVVWLHTLRSYNQPNMRQLVSSMWSLLYSDVSKLSNS